MLIDFAARFDDTRGYEVGAHETHKSPGNPLISDLIFSEASVDPVTSDAMDPTPFGIASGIPLTQLFIIGLKARVESLAGKHALSKGVGRTSTQRRPIASRNNATKRAGPLSRVSSFSPLVDAINGRPDRHCTGRRFRRVNHNARNPTPAPPTKPTKRHGGETSKAVLGTSALRLSTSTVVNSSSVTEAAL